METPPQEKEPYYSLGENDAAALSELLSTQHYMIIEDMAANRLIINIMGTKATAGKGGDVAPHSTSTI